MIYRSFTANTHQNKERGFSRCWWRQSRYKPLRPASWKTQCNDGTCGPQSSNSIISEKHKPGFYFTFTPTAQATCNIWKLVELVPPVFLVTDSTQCNCKNSTHTHAPSQSRVQCISNSHSTFLMSDWARLTVWTYSTGRTIIHSETDFQTA